MEIDAELRRQITVSLAAAAVFVVGLIGIGVTFGGSTVLPQAGAIALIALLAGFVLLMGGVGMFLMRAGDES
ncbi:hypothetical protein [uncultured Halorubrum sp.]|jgi:hypothetical protein|uniref:DUF7472 family protein n=1 Tax=uncultured Halorubrum sp. TaxID=399555 RepID=UPI0026269373|nr:hypothetical protein [uncultured Halorubrum sp.]